MKILSEAEVAELRRKNPHWERGMKAVLESYETLRKQLADAAQLVADTCCELHKAQAALKLEQAKVKIALAVVTYEDRDICPEPYEFTTCPEGDGWKQGNCLACWQSYLDAEAARRVEAGEGE
jgi:hypothetical protein